MSADNWRVCPRCLHNAILDYEAARDTAADEYGKVDVTAWKELDATANAAKERVQMLQGNSPTNEERTLREDWGIGIGVTGDIDHVHASFGVNYKASCNRCQWSFEHNHGEQVFPKLDARSQG